MASDVEKQEMPDELIEVFTTKNRGRGVRVTREVKAGCLLLTEEPFEFVVKNGERGYYCDQCLAKRYVMFKQTQLSSSTFFLHVHGLLS